VKAVVGALLATLLLSACGGSDEPSSKPTFGGGAEPSGASAGELADLKAAAGIEDCPASDAKAPSDDALPDVVLDCLGGGRKVKLAGLAGTPTVINLWASWCGPCRDELPLLARADRDYDGRVRVLGIDMAHAAPEAALRLAKDSEVTYPLLVDRSSKVRGPLRVSGLPMTVFMDSQGRMVFTERTPFRSYADVTAAIRQHLGVER
jgi:thiol-disulfide isomerase/thioredoxin